MDLKRFILTIFILYILINGLSLFLQEFNYLKIVISANIIISIIGIVGFLNLLKVQVFKKERYIDIIENILDLIPSPICLYDDSMKIIYANKAFENFVKISRDTLQNFQVGTWIMTNPLYLNLSLIFFPSLSATNIKTYPNPDIIEVNYKNQIIFDLISTKIKIKEESYNAKILSDKSIIIKELKEKDEFISLVAHHLRTPLNQVKWFLESLGNLENFSNEDKEMVKNLSDVLSKAVVLAESVLLFTRLEESQIKPEVKDENIEELIFSCLDLLKLEIKEKNLQIKVEIDEEAKIIPLDRKIIFFALYPIIENSVNYNKENGSVEIKIDRLKDRPEIKIEIKDTGIGISDKEKKELFKKFFRSDKAKEIKPTGVGIGLYLAKNLIEIHKGKIEVESEENVGTTVKIFLPSYKEAYEQ